MKRMIFKRYGGKMRYFLMGAIAALVVSILILLFMVITIFIANQHVSI